ncbi:NAD(P)/FAD-dependent oxidoreductase [Acetobacterium wieringae]|uniref:NAD(P)/FAD-dependent oxidoreductase n=1 Tax=Acetobacterium wieringae TaxID=52694 RepID=UPI0026EB5902|nr:NAD(P)/FAD-dependent oxidoreductase [Acetobacterium wieringae]
MNHYDVIIIGGGITGTAIAHELSKFKLSVALLERGTDIGIGATKGNGGVVHPGYDPTPGSLKAKINVQGANAYPQLAKELNFDIINPGIFVLGFNEADRAALSHKLDFGIKNGVRDLAIIDAQTIHAREPHLSEQARFALYAPTATVVDPFEVAIAFAENAAENGVAILTGQPVTAITKTATGFVLTTVRAQFSCGYIVNAAGNHADDVAKLAGIAEYTMKPRHGDLLVFDKDMGNKPQTVMFPCPGPDTKGIACIPTVHGNTLVGSTATMKDDKEAVNNYAPGIQALIDGAKKIVPELDTRKIIRSFAGLRPVVLDHNNDFFIAESVTVKGFIHAAGIQSPGIASAPAIAELIRDLLDNAGLKILPKANFNPYRKTKTVFSKLGIAQQDELIKKNPAYGRIVCRCETVTEGEIVDAIHGIIPAQTLDGIKRRTRAGMGRCQGGFCQYKIIAILSRELGLPSEEILLEDIGSNLLCGSMKGGALT